MNCLKCGRETEDGKVFCEECLKVMEKYPVKPGTAVLLPKRSSAPAAKKTRWRPTPSVEEQLTKARHENRVLIAAVCVLILLLGVGSYFTTRYLIDRRPMRPGQNYTTAETVVPVETK